MILRAQPARAAALTLWLAAAACQGEISHGAQASSSSMPAASADAPSRPGATEPAGRPGAGGVAAMPTAPGNAVMPLPGIPAAGAPCMAAPAPARIWRLTRSQINNTIERLLPNAGRPADRLVRDTAVAGFTNAALSLATPQLMTEQLLAAVGPLGTRIAAAAAQRAACMASTPSDPACVRQFIERFGGEAYRRPLTPAEINDYVTFYSSQFGTLGAETLSVLVRGMLMSPAFLFRSELGAADAPAGRVALDDFEIASLLSYSLTDMPPDATLLALAQQGKLGDRSLRSQQAIRLLNGSGNATAVLSGFFHEVLDLDQVIERPKSAVLFPRFNAQLAGSAVAETDRFVREVLWNDDGRLRTLLTATYSFPNQAVAEVMYGLSSVKGASLQKTTLPPGQRLGILLQPAVMAGFATEEEGELVHRGKFVREKLLCQSVPPPPPMVNAAFPPANPMLTHRQRFEQHMKDPSCQSCHRLLDPVGAGFENYDAIGRFQTMDKGRPIDATGVISGVPGGGDVAFAGPLDLVSKLAGSDDVHDCLLRQAFRYIAGRVEQAGDGCMLASARTAFATSGGHVLTMVAALAAADDLVVRTK